jgi:hypothetical protein
MRSILSDLCKLIAGGEANNSSTPDYNWQEIAATLVPILLIMILFFVCSTTFL